MGTKSSKPGGKKERSPTQSVVTPPPTTSNGVAGRPHAATLPSNLSNASPNNNTPPQNTTPQKPSSDIRQSNAKSAITNTKKDDSQFNIKKLEEVFAQYMDPDDNSQIGPEGMTKFCKHLEVEPEDVVVLVLAWRLEASQMGFFTREEFMKGFQKLNLDSLPKIKAHLKVLREDLKDPVRFKDIYKYAFNFAKEKNQRYLEIPTAQAMLQLLLGDDYPHCKPFLSFLNEQTSYKSLNIDQWMSFLEFSKTIKEDLSNYDPTSAWPVMMDEYVEWKQNLNKDPANEEEATTGY